jgi:putative endopeptidase
MDITTRSLAWALISGMALVGVFACDINKTHPIVDPIDQTAVDSSVRPQDDFFSYANGGWLKRTEIPPSQIAWGGYFTLIEQSVTDIFHILDSLGKEKDLKKGTLEQKVADLYTSLMDSAKMEAKGLGPLNKDFARIDSITNVAGLIDEVVLEYKWGNGQLFSFYAGPDDRNSSMVVAHFDQGGLGLPNKDYYFTKDTSILKVKKTYQDYIKTVFSLIGHDSALAAKEAAGVLKAETELAKTSKSETDLQDPVANYHKLAIADLDKLTPGLNWHRMLNELGVLQDSLVVGQPEFYRGMYISLHSVALDDWKSYMKFHLVDTYSDVLDSQVFNSRFTYINALGGQKQPDPRWKRAAGKVDFMLGDALGQLYVKRYFSPESKQRISDMVDNLKATFAEHIRQLSWMSDSTKKRALFKLQAVAKKIGYPDKWKDYSSVVIDDDDAVGNIRRCSTFEYQRNQHKIGKPVDRSEWITTAPTVNGFYNPVANDINFPAGILHPPFFFKDGDDAVNYGAIGWVIGHEITHGFDNRGRQYDANGNLTDWWLPEDAVKFRQRANLVVQQYNQYISIDTFHINGNMTLAENIADIGGLSIAYGAFKKTAQGQNNTKIGELTPDQRFFRAFAQVLCAKERPELLRTSVMADTHSANQFRGNGPLSDFNAFYDTYQVKPGDKMYRPDSLRVQIW